MKQLSKFIQEKLHISNYKQDILKNIAFIKDTKDCTILTLLDKDDLNKIVVKMVIDDNFDNGKYELKDITDEYDCYDYNENEQKLIDYALENDAGIYNLMNERG